MTVAEFLAWSPQDKRRWQLVDGVPEAMAAELLRRAADGGWPAEAARIISGDLHLRSIDLVVPLAACDATTRLARPQM